MFKKKALVIIKGGLGNQLFQLSLCNLLKVQGFDVYIDINFYQNKELLKHNTKRHLELSVKELNFKIASKNTAKWFYKMQKIKTISNYQKGHNYNLEQVRYFNIFDGYWQNTENLNFSIEYLKNVLSNQAQFKKDLNSKPVKGSTLIHVRRTDYVGLNQELNIQYYSEALSLASNEIENFYFDVFTDDIDWVNKNSLFSNANKIYDSNSFEGSSIKTFSEMLGYENYIISNSTFSFLAAFIGGKSNSKIVKPYPWFPNRKHNFDNFSKWTNINWKLENERF